MSFRIFAHSNLDEPRVDPNMFQPNWVNGVGDAVPQPSPLVGDRVDVSYHGKWVQLEVVARRWRGQHLTIELSTPGGISIANLQDRLRAIREGGK